MRISIKDILLLLLLLAIQLLLSNYVNLGSYIIISILPYIILILPFSTKQIPTMLLGFSLGILFDLLGNGIIGLNAAALTAMSLCRSSFLQLITTEQSFTKYDVPTFTNIGILRFSVFTLLSLLVYFTVYVLVENMSFSPFGFNILRIVISSLINTALILLLCAIIQNRRK